MELLITPGGSIHSIYGETIDFASLGIVSITRASHVEPDSQGRWWADLSPIDGPRLGPFGRRSQALAAEIEWLSGQLQGIPISNSHLPQGGAP